MFFLICFICVFNILMWIVFISKFRKLFSTENIIASTKEDMNHIVEDINRNTSRDITLIDNKLRELKAAVADADRHLVVFKNEVSKQTQTVSLQNRIKESISSFPQTPVQKAAEKYMRNGMNIQNQFELSLTDEGVRQVSMNAEQEKTAEPAPTQFTVERNGTSYASVPVIGPEIKYTDNPITTPVDFNDQVKTLYQRGLDVSQIATQLKRTITEVQLVLDMGL